MTPQEAIEFFEETIVGCKFTRDKQLKEVCKIAKFAIEKQMPKKPHRSGTYHVCPYCSHFVNKNEQKHGKINIPNCKWCGQALDWSET